jgi:hypothetical protein
LPVYCALTKYSLLIRRKNVRRIVDNQRTDKVLDHHRRLLYRSIQR